ncbi:hypothetical protein HanLR1_Chr00c3448g0879991 [Helianthus annuus]|nr:hypothetical protein HanLR1_Chr00c3448g0879991 [Helianthus annuus]
MAYLYCTPQQTQNVHEYHEDHSPPCEHAFFTTKLGSYAVPLIDANKCVGVLEVVTNTPRDYNDDIRVAKGVIERAGLQTTMQIDSTITLFVPKERSRETFTSLIISYCCLNKYFGLSSVCAKKALEGIIKRSISDGTFTNLCRSAGIPEWPCIIQKKTDRSFVTLNDDLISILYEIMTTIPSAQEIRTNPVANETSGDTRDWNEPEPEHAHPSHMAAIGDLMENHDNNIYPARVHLDSMDIDHLGADPIWDEGLPGEETMTTIPSAQEIRTNPFASGDAGDWNESESEHAHPSLMATIGDLMENQDNNIDPARVHLDFVDIGHLRADALL